MSGIFLPSRRLYREKRKGTAPLDKSGRAVLYYWHEGMTLFARLLPLGLEHQEAKPLSGDHRMAALLISLLLVAAAIGHGGNYKRNNHTNHRQNLKISHDPFPLSPLLGGVRGRRKAKRHLLSFRPWSRFTGSMIIIPCQTMSVKPSEQLFNMLGLAAHSPHPPSLAFPANAAAARRKNAAIGAKS